MMNRLIVAGSPRSAGRSARLAELVFEACIEECPDDELALVPVSELSIAGCTGCDACKASEGHVCVIEDDMVQVRELIDDAEELVVVSPVYFSGAPSQMKALLDRLQPYFWAGARHGEKRPATLHIVGEGGDPHGYGALVGEVRSALSCAGFSLVRVLDWVGKIDEAGEISSEADELVLEPFENASDDDRRMRALVEDDEVSDAGAWDGGASDLDPLADFVPYIPPRPKLDISSDRRMRARAAGEERSGRRTNARASGEERSKQGERGGRPRAKTAGTRGKASGKKQKKGPAYGVKNPSTKRGGSSPRPANKANRGKKRRG